MSNINYKKILLGLIAISIIIWGLYKVNIGVIALGLIALTTILYLTSEALQEAIIALIKKKFNIDLEKDIFKQTAQEIEHTMPGVPAERLNALENAPSINAATIAASGIFMDFAKDKCERCHEGNMIEIDWKPEIDNDIAIDVNKIINKHLLKCDKCGNTIVKYSYN